MSAIFDTSRAQRAVRFIENLKHTKSPFHGKPFKLLPWQHQVVSDVYGTLNPVTQRRQFKYCYLEIGKKNGKSELVAALALYHLFFDGEINGEVYGCAGDRQQATLVFDVAVDMIDQTPALKKRARIQYSTKRITDTLTGTYYQVVSAEAYTKHGLNVSAVIFDELHVQPNRELWDVMTKGAGDARAQPIWWVITTAGDDPDRVSIGWEVHEKAASIIEARANGDTEKDVPTWYPVIYAYEGEDIYNEANWAKANPSLDVTFSIERMREAAHEAKLSPAEERIFRWLRLNQWTTTKLTNWLPIDLFDSTSASNWTRSSLLKKDCYLGLDLSTTIDLSALALVFPPQGDQADWRVIWDCFIPEENMQARIREDHVPYDKWTAEGWIFPTPGNVIDYNVIEARIVELKGMYNILEVDADPSFATMLLQRLTGEHGLDVVEIPQYYKNLTDPMQMIEVLLRNGELSHEPNPVARWCFGNTSIHMNGNGQIKYVKESKGRRVQRNKRIDLVAAWVCAMARAKFYESSASVYNTRGLMGI